MRTVLHRLQKFIEAVIARFMRAIHGVVFSWITRTNRVMTVLLLTLIVVCGGLPITSANACSGPGGQEGEVIYNSAHGVLQYCDSNNWIAMVGADPDDAEGPTNGLVGYWKLDEQSGTTAADELGNNDGTMQGGLTGSDSVAGLVGTALQLDDFNDVITVPHAADFDLVGDLTLSLWFRRLTSHGGLVSKGASDNSAWNYGVYMSASNYLIFYSDDTVPTSVSSNTTITDTDWHHVVVTREGNDVTIYLDGIVEASGTMAGAFGTDSFDVHIGKSGDIFSGDTFGGTIDDVRIYDRALTAQEVVRLYNTHAIEKATEIVTDGLVAYWRLDETSGTIIDSVGTNNGTGQNGIQYASTGIIGTAMGFDGDNDKIEVASGGSIDNLESHTYSAWIYPITYGETDDGIIMENGNGAKQMRLFNDSGEQSIRVNVGASTDAFANGVNNAIALNTWQHVAYTFDNTGDRIPHIYVNGQRIATSSEGAASGGIDPDSSNDMVMGADSGTTGRAFKGRIDDVRIYDRALSADEVEKLAQSRAYAVRYNEAWRTPEFFDGNRWISMAAAWDTISDGLVGHWKLDETTGTIAADSSGNGNDGTMSNGLDADNDSAIGAVGRAIRFEGTAFENELNVAHDAVFSPDDFSLAAWIYVEADDGQQAYNIINKEENTGNRYGMDVNFPEEALRCYNDVASTSVIIQSANNSISFGRWHHVVCRYDTTNEEISIYIDGVQAATPVATGGLATQKNTEDLNIGYRHNIGGPWKEDYFNGMIDDVRIYSRVLTTDEITTLYNMGAPVGANTALPQGCPNIGDVCDDGTVYAGTSPDGSVAMFTTPADAPGGDIYTWNDGSTNWANVMAQCTTIQPTCETGAANTALLLGLDGSGTPAPYDAAEYCGALGAHGSDDWYLPSRDELDVLHTNKVAIGNFDTDGADSWYWTSSERNNFPAWGQRFSDGGQSESVNKDSPLRLRCVRKGAAPRCASPYGVAGSMIYNDDANVLQYCDGARWIGIGKVD